MMGWGQTAYLAQENIAIIFSNLRVYLKENHGTV
jgi:hypothetical protein